MSKGIGNKKLAYAIVRVSTSNQKTDSQAVDIVKVADKMGYTIPKEYIFEESISGVDKDKDINYDRDSIKKLKRAIDIKKPDAIFCWELSRLTRTPNKVSKYIIDLSLKPHIPLYIYKFGEGGIWTIDPENGETQDQNTKAIRAAADAVYDELLKIRERTMRGRNNKAEKGKFVGHVADGYLVDGYGEFYVDEKRKPDIIKIFELYANHDYPTDAIASILNSEGVKTATHYRATSDDFPKYTPQYHRRLKGGGEVLVDRTTHIWTGELVSQCLNNSWYRGKRTYLIRTDKDLYEKDPKKIKKLERHYFDVPVFIKKELIEKVDEKLRNNRIIPSSTASKHNYLLSTLIYCGKCGKPMYGHHGGLYNHYYCSSAETKDKCGNAGVNQQNIEAIVIERIKKKAVDDLFGENKSKELIDFYNNESVIREYKDKYRVAELSERRSLDIISEKQKAIEKAVELQLKATSPFTIQAYSDNIQDAENAIKREEAKLPDFVKEKHKYDRLIKQTKNIGNTIKSIEKTKKVEEYISLVKTVIQRVEVYSPERNTHIIIITFVNNKQETILYNPYMIKNGYIVLPFGKVYDIDEKSVEASQQFYLEEYGIDPDPNAIEKLKEGQVFYDATIQKIVIRGKLYFIHGGIMVDDGDGLEEQYQQISDYCIKNNISEDEKRRLIQQETPQSKVYWNEMDVKELMHCYKLYAKSLINYYQREEPSDEKSIIQKEHYKELERKKNTGLPTSLPRLERDDNTEQILIKCKRIYNQIYKIKNKKNLTDEEKEQRIGELKDVLAKYRVMKRYIKREEQVRRFHENANIVKK